MKFSIFTLGLAALAQLTVAAPLEKRTSTSEAASIGYSTEGDGTAGGASGAVTTVSSLAALKTPAASNVDAKVIVVKGTITGNTVVSVASNKSILGTSSSSSKLSISAGSMEKFSIYFPETVSVFSGYERIKGNLNLRLC
ncbi:hypothetical protein RUND412_010745 [Rhizina undulata]